jgi:hypothetical protein
MSRLRLKIDLLRKAKMAAVQMDTSLNSIIRTLLAGFVSSVGDPIGTVDRCPQKSVSSSFQTQVRSLHWRMLAALTFCLPPKQKLLLSTW